MHHSLTSKPLNLSIQVLYDNALTERDAPIEGCMIPPSYAKLVSMVDHGYPSGQMGGPRSTAATAELYQAASAAHWIAKYNQEKNIPGKVSSLRHVLINTEFHGSWCIGYSHPKRCIVCPRCFHKSVYAPSHACHRVLLTSFINQVMLSISMH